MIHLTARDALAGDGAVPARPEHVEAMGAGNAVYPQIDAEYIARMKDMLDLYVEAPDHARPAVCFDESSTKLISEARQPLSAEPG